MGKNPNLYFPDSLNFANEIEVIENLKFNLENLNAMYPMPEAEQLLHELNEKHQEN